MTADINKYIEITEHPRVLSWFSELAKSSFDQFNALVGDNSKALERVLGKPARNSNPEFNRFWFYAYRGLQFKIVNGEKSGTVFLVKSITTEDDFKTNNLLGMTIIEFLNEISPKIIGKF